jgi:hypothetical protein
VNPLLGLTSLRVLRLMDMTGGSQCWLLEGLSSLSSLRRLRYAGVDGEAVLTLVKTITQLTSLELFSISYEQPSPSSRSSLLQLTGLQRLLVNQAWVPACHRELGALSQLTELLVVCPGAAEGVDPGRLLAPLTGQLPALQQVVCVYDCPPSDFFTVPRAQQPALEVVPSPLAGVRVMLGEWRGPLSQAILRPRRTCACPHLRGVWEVVA